MSLRALIYFHTASGNTGWVTGQIAQQLRDRRVEVVTRNIAYEQDTTDMDNFDLTGFGCPVMGFRPTFSMSDFIDSLPLQQEKPAFIYVTCAGICASSLWMLSQLLNKKGRMVIAAQQFKAEVSWPVARLPGITPDKGRPDARDLPSIQHFTKAIYEALKSRAEKRPVTPLAIPFAFLNPFCYMGRANKAPYLSSIMGTKKVIESRCTRCGMCQKYCASHAISLNPYPQFSSACTGCWGCYNICPEAAISTFTGTRSQVASARESHDIPALGQAESALRLGLGNLFAVAEAYPELKTNETFQHLQARITGLENAIADRREFYNDSVNVNNVRVEQFPDTVVARLFGFRQFPLLRCAAEEKKDVDLKQLFGS